MARRYQGVDLRVTRLIPIEKHDRHGTPSIVSKLVIAHRMVALIGSRRGFGTADLVSAKSLLATLC
jgi:hypothetical protein